jgi:hypothetical protein
MKNPETFLFLLRNSLFFQLTVSRVSENGTFFLFHVRKEEVVIIKKYFGTPGSIQKLQNFVKEGPHRHSSQLIFNFEGRSWFEGQLVPQTSGRIEQLNGIFGIFSMSFFILTSFSNLDATALNEVEKK